MARSYVREILPKTQISATGAAWTAGSIVDFSSKIPTVPMDALLLGLYGDNVTDEALMSEIVSELLSKIYIYHTTYGSLLDISGPDYLALLRMFWGLRTLPLFGGVTDNAERFLEMPIMFTHPKFPNLGLPASPAGSVVTQVTLGTSSNIDGADYQVDGVYRGREAPTEVLLARTLTFVPSATGAELKTRLTELGRCLGLLLYGTTAGTTISKIKILVDDKEVGDLAVDKVFKSWWQVQNLIGDIYGKFSIYEKVPSAAADNGPASLPSAVEWVKDLLNYTWIDFTEEPLAVGGHKFELAGIYGDTNQVRVIPVLAVPVA
jgi:hypothetical protein